mmetsp:Transcript_23274/g.23484  ORF Transcript_23274/g.23484 Transcript_23274/m.23484 type:complete len:491 (+) Transcript_23274:56-1528(+)
MLHSQQSTITSRWEWELNRSYSGEIDHLPAQCWGPNGEISRSPYDGRGNNSPPMLLSHGSNSRLPYGGRNNNSPPLSHQPTDFLSYSRSHTAPDVMYGRNSIEINGREYVEVIKPNCIPSRRLSPHSYPKSPLPPTMRAPLHFSELPLPHVSHSPPQSIARRSAITLPPQALLSHRPRTVRQQKGSTDPNHLLKVTRKAVADETLSVLRKGSYSLPNGVEVNVSERLKNSVDRATCFSPDYYFLEEVGPRFGRMIVEVTEETTLQACKRLYDETGGDVGCLAFSSGKNPGGGFLGGSGGQEESIARSSAYYLCVIKDPQLYEFNRSHKDPYHSDHLIVSPEIPIIREEKEPYTLREPWSLTVISAPAVNAGVVRSRNQGCPRAEAEIHRRMRNRIRRILGAAVEHGVSRLVLGEYGCGALENNPRDIARYFKEELLCPGSPFACAFDRVVFAVHDDTGSQNCGRQRSPCLPDFVKEICPVGKPTVVYREI